NAEYDKRDSIWQWHKDYTLGLAWFLRSDPGVPEKVREYMGTFGLCKDEYVNNGHFPHQLYIRIGRRMKGEYFLTQHNLMEDTVKYDVIGMGSYNIDVREVQRNYISISRFPDMKHEVYNEGYLSIPVAQYEIPYRSLLPAFDECKNLLVSVCISGSALAIASVRMEPQYMIMGESAGIAAAIAVQSSRPVHLIDTYRLQEKLKSRNQVLSLKTNPYGVWSNENEIVIDNTMKGFTAIYGDWIVQETGQEERYEMNFRYSPEGKEGSFRFIPYFFRTGTYDVYIWYPSSELYQNRVKVRIFSSAGDDTQFVNQQKNGGSWIKIGRYEFTKGRHKSLSIEADTTDKTVVADAVKFTLVK
ncbi:MAG: FAD-dependent oxidoreductase, partial [Cyclobacteriaceae bacterium]|nr:FAD-dependent oxidoreductase [Cyclobacteriaceae bacterium]